MSSHNNNSKINTNNFIAALDVFKKLQMLQPWRTNYIENMCYNAIIEASWCRPQIWPLKLRDNYRVAVSPACKLNCLSRK